MIAVNQVLSVGYPVSTDVTARLEFRDRELMVRRVRDLVTEPLTIAEYLRRPLVRRSRFLLSGTDLSCGQFRRFYLRSAREFLRDTPLRVGMFEGGHLVELTRTNWGPTARDRMALARFLGRFAGANLGGLEIGVFSDDLEMIL
jgi:hypothetical protein